MHRQCSLGEFEARVASDIWFVSGTRSPNNARLAFDVCRTRRALQIDHLIHPRMVQSGTVEYSPSSARLARSRVKARGRSIDPLGGLGDACAGPGIARVPRKHRSACALLLLPCTKRESRVAAGRRVFRRSSVAGMRSQPSGLARA